MLNDQKEILDEEEENSFQVAEENLVEANPES